MKICNFSFSNGFNMFIGSNTQKFQEISKDNQNINDFYPSLSETIGRSLVVFTGKNDKFLEYDKNFVDAAAQNLRMSEEDKNKFKNSINDYLLKRNYSTLEDFAGDNNEETQAEFVEYVSNKMNFSELDNILFTEDAVQRFYYDSEYEPYIDVYKKDMDTLNKILDKYLDNPKTKNEIRNLMREDARTRYFDSVFDIVKRENDPASFMDLLKNYVELDDETSLNIILDLVKVDKNNLEKYTPVVNDKNDIYQQQIDAAICDEIVREFGLSSEEAEEILPEIEKRYSKNIKQIAFELSDKYKLPSGSEKFIENTINVLDKNFLPFVKD